jgi:hypothetical protein
MRPASARSLAFQLSNDVDTSRGHQEGGLVGCASSCAQVDRRQDAATDLPLTLSSQLEWQAVSCSPSAIGAVGCSKLHASPVPSQVRSNSRPMRAMS